MVPILSSFISIVVLTIRITEGLCDVLASSGKEFRSEGRAVDDGHKVQLFGSARRQLTYVG